MSRFVLPAAVAPLDVEGARRRYLDLLKAGEALSCGCPRGTQFHRIACFPLLNEPPKCLACHATEGVEFESPRTAYARVCSCKDCHAGLGLPCIRGCASVVLCADYNASPDPNASIPLCRHCARVHYEEMEAQWQEYRAGQM
jgi:hypothetical protein